jgi:hypothetical protein
LWDLFSPFSARILAVVAAQTNAERQRVRTSPSTQLSPLTYILSCHRRLENLFWSMVSKHLDVNLVHRLHNSPGSSGAVPLSIVIFHIDLSLRVVLTDSESQSISVSVSHHWTISEPSWIKSRHLQVVFAKRGATQITMCVYKARICLC